MIPISIITPVLNGAATIRRTVESILSQDYPALDYWVIDGGSQDGTVDILREYESDPRFHWLSEPDGGPSDAINKGLARAKGEVFNWIDADDYLRPGALHAVGAAFAEHPPVEIVSGSTYEFQDPNQFQGYRQLQMRRSAEASILTGLYNQPGTFWKTAILRDLGGADTRFRYMMDWHMWVRYLLSRGQERVLILGQMLACFRRHPEAKRTKNPDDFHLESAAIFHEIGVSLKAPAEFLQPDAMKEAPTGSFTLKLGPHIAPGRYLGAYCDQMVRSFRRRDRAQARQWLWRGFHYRPWISWWRLKMAIRLFFPRKSSSSRKLAEKGLS